MSKSVGNVIAPQEIIDRYGADILRLWVASEDYRGEIPISDNILQRLGESYRRIRNTARYILGNTHDFDPRTDALPASELLEMDRWMLGRCAQVQQEIHSAYEQFQFHRVVQAMHNFCSIDLGGLYLDVLKDRLYTTQTQSRARRSAQTVLAKMLDALLVWMAPILSFTAEEIWRHLPWKNAESVFFACYPDFGEGQDADLDARWQRLLALREAVNAALEQLRQEKKIGSALDAQVTLSANADWLALLRPMAKELRFLLLCSDLQLRDLAVDAEEALPGLQITVAAYDATKCPRCWHRRSDIGEHPEHPELCSRCVENVAGSGETREYC